MNKLTVIPLVISISLLFSCSKREEGEGFVLTGPAAQRVQGFKKMGKAFKALKYQSQRSSINLPVVQSTSAELQALSDDLLSWFPPRPEGEIGNPAAFMLKVWDDPEGFTEAAEDLREKVQRLHGVTSNSQLRLELEQVAQSCKSCHVTYRGKDDI